MRATFTPEQHEIERAVAGLSTDGLRAARSCLEHGYAAPDFDAALLADYGALGVPESAGGFGSSLVDLAVAVEALGRTLAPSRLPAHAAAVQLAAAAGIDVTPAVDGGQRWAIAADEPAGDGWEGAARIDGGVTRGGKTLVAHAEGADALVAVFGETAALLPAEGLVARESLDPSRPVWDVDLDGRTPQASGPVGSGLLAATVVAAADLCGAGNGAVRLGADYAREREQFGTPIGAFQGVAFQLADAFVGLKAAWDLTLYAAWAVEEGEPDAAACVHAAKARAGEAALFAAERTVQVHGGMGITMEADPHLYVRRVLATDPWLGSSRWHRRRLGRLRLDGPGRG